MEKFLTKYRSKHHGKRKLDEIEGEGETSATSPEDSKGVVDLSVSPLNTVTNGQGENEDIKKVKL